MSTEVQHMLSVLRSVIRGLGYNYQDVAKKLGLSSGYMSRLFSGKIDLKFQHIVDISRVLGFEPEEIFHLAYPRAKDVASPSALRFQMLTQPDSALSGSSRVLASINSAAEEEEMERRVASALRKILAPPAPPSTPSKEDLEKLMERMLLKFIGGIQSAQG